MNRQTRQTVRTNLVQKCITCKKKVPEDEMCHLNPCSHGALCLNCLLQLEPLHCPICKNSITTVTTSAFITENESPKIVSVNGVRAGKKRLDGHALETVQNTFFVGDSNSGKVELINKLKQKYHYKLYPEESYFYSKFHPNVLIGGRRSMRFVQFPVPWFDDQNISRDDIQNLRSKKIQLIVVCVQIAENAPTEEVINKVNEVGNILLRLERYYFGTRFKAFCVIRSERSSARRQTPESGGQNGLEKLGTILSQYEYFKRYLREIALCYSVTCDAVIRHIHNVIDSASR